MDVLALVTNRPPLVMRARDGSIVEVFEWKSTEAIEEAHKNEAVRTMWKDFEKVCEYEKLSNLPECQEPFSSFEPVDL